MLPNFLTMPKLLLKVEKFVITSEIMFDNVARSLVFHNLPEKTKLRLGNTVRYQNSKIAFDLHYVLQAQRKLK